MINKASINLTIVLVSGVIFTILIAGLFDFILTQHKISRQKLSWYNSLQIAEAGINYYRWHLNASTTKNNPLDIQDGNDWCCEEPPCEKCGPYEHIYYDNNGKPIGKFILEIKKKEICNEILGVYITSWGFTNEFPNVKRKITAKLAATTIADYAWLLNEGVWFGGEVKGKIHSNNGIRMDATSNNIVSSAQNEWICTYSFGCSASNCPSSCTPIGSNCRCPGIFGSGGPQSLWRYPVNTFDFDGLTSDLAGMKTLAQSYGLYYPPSTDINSNAKGYHLILNSDGTFDLRIITQLQRFKAWMVGIGWHWSYEKILNEVPYQTNVALPEACGLIYLEDNLWIEGTTKGKITIASADLINPSRDTSVIINGNLDYTTLNGEDSLALITEKDILIPLYSPDNLTIRGVLVSQKGYFARKYYYCGWYYPECIRNYILFYGTKVSYKRPVTTWVNSSMEVVSGYRNGDDYFDVQLAKDPPPLLPYVSDDLNFVSWEEE